MYTEPLPYALDPLRFPFPALAALAGRLPLGGGREVALAALMMARLATGLLASESLPLAERTTRAAAARVWLASVALPATSRTPLTRCVDASTGTPQQAAIALRSVIIAVRAHLDGASAEELEQLASRLSGQRVPA